MSLTGKVFLENNWEGFLFELFWENFFLRLLIREIVWEEATIADRFWKSMPAALKRLTLDELYKRLRDLDYAHVDERLAVMLKAILQLEAKGECRSQQLKPC